MPVHVESLSYGPEVPTPLIRCSNRYNMAVPNFQHHLISFEIRHLGEIRFFCPRYFCHISSIREFRFFTIGKIDRETGVLPIVATVALLDSQRFLDRLDFFPRYAWVISVGFTARNHRCIHFFSNLARRTFLASVSSIYSNGLSVNP